MKHEEYCDCSDTHCNCEHEHHHCDCNHEHEHTKTPFKIGSPCVLDPDKKCNGCKECLMCDLDPNKICNNCGKCIDFFNTDEKGYVSIKVDKVITDADESTSLDDLLKQYGLDDEDDE